MLSECRIRIPDLSPQAERAPFSPRQVTKDLLRQHDFGLNYEHHVARASEKLRVAISEQWPDIPHPPSLVITRGSGMEALSSIMETKVELHACNLHEALTSIVPGHDDRIAVGMLNGAVVMIVPRLHGQENADKLHAHLYPRMIPDICANIAMAKEGPRVLYLGTHAAGGIDTRLHKGDIVVPDTHSLFKFPMHLLGEVGRILDFGENVKGRRGGEIFVSQIPENGMYPEDAIRQFALIAEKHYPGRVHSRYVNSDVGISTSGYWLGRIYQAVGDIIEARQAGLTTIGQSPLPELIAWVARGGDALDLTVVTNVMGKDHKNPVGHRDVTETAGEVALQQALAKIFSEFAAYAEQRYIAQLEQGSI